MHKELLRGTKNSINIKAKNDIFDRRRKKRHMTQ